MGEFKLFPHAAVFDLLHFLKAVELGGGWPADLRETLYLLLPKDGTRDAGRRMPIALLPQVCRLWSAACKQNVQHWRQVCRDRGEVPVGAGALDETFDLALKTDVSVGILTVLSVMSECLLLSWNSLLLSVASRSMP
eukprot:3804035-Amphidinium_carterae.1